MRRVGGVRVRITAAAVTVTALTLMAATTALLSSVERSLVNDLRAGADQHFERLRGALEAGADPARIPVWVDGPWEMQVVVNGQVVSSSRSLDGTRLPNRENLRDLAGGDTLTVRSQVSNGPEGTVELVASTPRDSVEQSVAAVRRSLLYVVPVLVALTGLAAWFLTGRALRPVETMRRQVDDITAGTLDRRVPEPGSGDEITRLAVTMNAMLDRIEAAHRRQQEFVADASHELRSPLATIRAELEVALHTGAPNGWPRVADTVLAEEARLESVINDLLVLARLDDPATALPTALVDVSAVAAAVTDRRPSQEIVRLDAPDPVVVTGVAAHLRRAFTNLIDNAARHADHQVVVTVRQEGDAAVVIIDDDGAGIPEADRDRVFERFTRLDTSRTRQDHDSGAGLGLALVRQIALAHGGQVTASTSPLGGARLTVRLPAPMTAVSLS